jgi:prepilin-type N-terminal cleavage/methylation domain-containing protein
MSRSQRGFTLLEVTLAMTALALVALCCYAALHLGVRAVERGEVAVVTAQRLRAATDVLIRQIKSTVAYPVRSRDDEVYPYFVGSATGMSFVTAAGLQSGGGLTRVVYQVADGPVRLMLGESVHFSPDTLGRTRVDEPERTAVLLDGFRTLKFEYLLSNGVDSEWRSEWNSYDEEMLPTAIRVLVEGLPGFEIDVWGQEIPLMLTNYGDNTGETSEDDVAARLDNGDEDEEEEEEPDEDAE